MSARDRAWLRGFLHLGRRAGTAVAARDIERQEDTVLRALSLLEAQPGVVLADEVGMGKTFEALGVLAARLRERPDARSLILTPGPDLNTKWVKELRAFCDATYPMYREFHGRFGAATTLSELISQLRVHQIVVAPVTVFIGGRAGSDLTYLLSLWGFTRKLAGNQLAAVFRRYGEGKYEHVQVEGAKLFDAFSWADVKPHVEAVARAHRKELGPRSLDLLWEAHGYGAFDDKGAIDRALADLRFRLVGRLVPALDLLIVDEAHKLKSADSVRTIGVRTALAGRFDRALFLTATPFQLSIDELRSVFELFALATSAPADLMARAEQLLGDVLEYQRAFDELGRLWATVDAALAADFARWLEGDPALVTDPEEVTLRPIAAAARRLLSLKRDRIEPRFREWMIRSLREDKRQYRRTQRRRIPPRQGIGVTFLLYERFIAELFRSRSPTHKAAVQINMVSSFSAAREGSLLADAGGESRLNGDAAVYRELLRRVLGHLSSDEGGHPKVDHVVADALSAVERDEKTLIFCTRTATLRELRRRIEHAWEQSLLERWRKVYPGANRDDVFEHKVGGKEVAGHHSRLRDRFSRAQDALYLALRERYAGTLLRDFVPTVERRAQLVAGANELLRRQRVSPAQAERLDWALAKRCVEQALALQLRDAIARGETSVEVDEQALEHLMDSRFIALGYDLEDDDVEQSARGASAPAWTIGEADVELVLQRDHLWGYLTGPLLGFEPALRVRTVERLASYLVKRNVPFLPELLAFAQQQGLAMSHLEARELLPVIDRFWITEAGRRWVDRMRRFLTYANGLDDARRKEVLDDAIRAGDLVRHTEDGESRERLREAFNTPLYPMVLVANEVMQEGLDLHHHCRRVVHHDLPWNPAQLEQRVGRVDRLGSLVQRLRERRPETTLDVLLPLIANTIDERLERTVRARERWLELLLGSVPTLQEDALPDQPAEPLPEALSEALRIELGPGPVGASEQPSSRA